MDCQQQQPTRPEERARHKFHSSPHLTESNLRRRRRTSSLTSPSSDRLDTPTTMKGSGAVTIASTVITAAATYSTAVSGSSLPDPPKQQSADQCKMPSPLRHCYHYLRCRLSITASTMPLLP
ncbi:LSD1 zinc finger, partial [Musa troglodytarum]